MSNQYNKKSFLDYKTEFESIDKNYIVLSEKYIPRKDGSRAHKFLIKHKICGHEFYTSKYNFVDKGYRCVHCSQHRPYIDNNIFKQKVQELVGDEYTVLGEYKNMYTKILLRHNVCGEEYYVAPKHFISGTRCPTCLHKSLLSTTFSDDIKKMSNGTLSIISEYNGRLKPIKVLCSKCNNTSITTFAKLQDQYKTKGFAECLVCSDKRSLGEKYILNKLIELNVMYNSQYKLSECKDIRPLPFDFVVYDKNDISHFVLIEFDGCQHFDPLSKFALNKFNEIQKHDKIKTEYCKTHNIPLLRLSEYNKQKCENQLIQFLKDNAII